MADAIGSFTGLGSGFDYQSLIDQIIANESKPATDTQNRIDKANAQLTAYKSYRSLLDTLETSAKAMRDGSAFDAVSTTVAGASANGHNVLTASASAGAAPGSYAVQVLSVAQAEKINSGTFTDSTTALGFTGDISVNGKTVHIVATDTLASVRDKINVTNTGTSPSGVSAAIISDSSSAKRLVLTSATTGSAGINLVDAGQGVATQLGWLNAQGAKNTLVAGADAQFTIDGVTLTRTTNTITDVIPDTTLTLTAADPTLTATVTIDRSADTVRSSVQAYVDAYNKLADFIKQQQTAASDPTNNPVLYNDPILRLARSSLASSMLQTIAGTPADLATAGMAGIAVTKDGHLSFDANKFNTAFNTRFSDVQTLFMERGTTDNSLLTYTSSTSATQGGTYAVNITQAAQQAQVLGSGFSGTYTDDGTPDVFTVTDSSNNFSAQVQLANGMTTSQIVDALNTAFATPQNQSLSSSTTLYADPSVTTPATSSTLLTSLYQPAGISAGVVPGDSINFSGTRADGTAFASTFTIGSNSTLGDLVTQIQSAMGPGATVALSNGKITVQAVSTGVSSLSLTLTPKNEGGGSLNFGAMNVTTTGRTAMSLTASAAGNQIKLVHNSYGASAGFSVSLTGGGTDNTAQLGLAAGSYHGTDVAGTIGGYAATGSGQQLVGTAGTPVDGLSVSYRDTALGAIGSVTLTQGVGAVVDRLIKSWTDDSTGTIASKETALNATIASQQKRLDDFNAKMQRRRENLLKQFLAMDTAVAKFKSQASAFSSVLAKNGASSA